MHAALKWSVAAAALFAASAPAMAAQIAAGSSIDVLGSDTAIPTSATVDAATGLSFQTVRTSLDPATATGDFAGKIAPDTLGTVTDSTLNLAVGAQAIAPFYSFTSGGNTLTFDLAGIDSVTRTAAVGATPAALTVQAYGTVNLTGFDATPGGFTITTNGQGVTTYSATTVSGAAAVPEPLSLALVGTALTGLGLLRRRQH